MSKYTNEAIHAMDEAALYSTALELTKLHVNQKVKYFHPNRTMPVQDVAWDCFTTLYMKGLFHRHDPDRSSFDGYVGVAVKNYLIDKERGAVRRLHTQSLDQMSEMHDSLDWIEVEEPVDDRARMLTTVLNVIDSCPAFRTSDHVKTASIDGEDYRLNRYNVLKLYLSGYSFDLLSKVFGVHTRIVSGMYKEGMETIRTQIARHGEDFYYDADLVRSLSDMLKCDKAITIEEHRGTDQLCYSKRRNKQGLQLFLDKRGKVWFTWVSNTPLARVRDRWECLGVFLSLFNGTETCNCRMLPKYKALYFSFFEGMGRREVSRYLDKWVEVLTDADNYLKSNR